MALKTYGSFHVNAAEKQLVISAAQPHVSIALKSIFKKIKHTATPPYAFPLTPQNCMDLQWFMLRYPLRAEESDLAILDTGSTDYQRRVAELETINTPDYVAPTVALLDGLQARHYQESASQMLLTGRRLLLGDELGLGKTLSGILSFLAPGTLPAAVVVQTHLPKQWQGEITRFTGLRTHLIKGTTPYSLPEADVYIFKYSQLAGWVNFFTQRFFKYAIFDEAQEFRKHESLKYRGGRVLSESCEYVIGLTGTPVYNYGEEIHSVLDAINPDCLGPREAFLREWCTPKGQHYTVDSPAALGSYLRDEFLFLRRTRAEVGRELPPVNKIVQTVDFDQDEVDKSIDLARTLALRMTTGAFEQRGQAARELDMLARLTTGVSKARAVAQYVKFLLEADEPVILAGWHRDVYDIWNQELWKYKPVMYTGSESANQKEEAKRAFLAGETNLFILSLRSGAGLDGLQDRCKTVVFGELDWSPKVHDQLIARADRDGQTEQVTAIFLVSEQGSDPAVINVLGLKSAQAHGIVDPLAAPAQQYSDESRMQQLAKQYLSTIEEPAP